MTKTVQPERPGSERRRKTRRVHVKLSIRERLLFRYWYVDLIKIVHKELRKDKNKSFVMVPKSEDCVLPKDAVREELRHVFKEDWKCSLDFDDIHKTIHMKDDR